MSPSNVLWPITKALGDPRPYFLTGKMDIALYDSECEFADPFVSFNGRDRFVANLENLAGGFIVESSTRMLSSEVDREAALTCLPHTRPSCW